MMTGELVFLTPAGALVAVAVVLPLACVALAARRVRRVRALLQLEPPPPARLLPRLLALAAVPALLGLAAAQPALRSTSKARVRTDAQALFVLDVSRSMRAAASPTAATRLTRAKRVAIALRAAIPQVPSGVATLTDRVLPDLLPVRDPVVFDQTVQHAVGIEQPPPQSQEVVATTLNALGAVGTQNFFPPSASHRLVVVLTDGESRPVDARQVARALATGPGVKLILVHVWAGGESVYDGTRPETGYREDRSSSTTLAMLAQAAGGEVVGEHAVSAAIADERAALGTGPTIVSGVTSKTRTLAPYLVLASLLPLLGLLAGGPALRLVRAARGRPGPRPAGARARVGSVGPRAT